nr:retrovirus-related Pol polyprotein from transposon TNT 1-94 [Tanacetum cinerariifolium]
MINRVYYVEGLNHNPFSVGQFCDADLEVAFRKSTCFVRDLQGNDLLIGNRGSDLYIISLQESNSSTPFCLMAKATPTQAWLWHRRLSNLNFHYINQLSKKDIVIGLPKLKYVRDQLCSSCELTSQLPLFFSAEVIATACYTQNRSIIIPTPDKTPYHIINDRKPSIKHLYIFVCICYITKDGENLDKMKEKGDQCILVGYSTQSKGYYVYNKRTPMIVESIHIRFDEIKEVSETSVANNTSGLVPQRQKASDYDNPDLIPQRQAVSSSADADVPSQQELDLLLGPLYDEFFNARSNPLTNVQSTSAPSTHINVHAKENNNDQEAEGEQLQDDEFTNPFCAPAQEEAESSSHNIDPEMCMYVLTMTTAKPKNIKVAMADSAWIEAMQEKLHQFDGLQVWELVDKSFGKLIIRIKWLWKNKKDEDQTLIRDKARLVAKGYAQTSVANNTSGLVPQRQKASDYDNPDLIPQRQAVSSSADADVPSQQKLDLLFGPLYDEFFNARSNPLTNEAMADSAWIEAMQEELHQFDGLQVWELVDKSFGKLIIRIKWLWKNKKDEDQTVIRDKARLVAKGYAQVYRLRKALYGLKQAPRAWYDELSKFLMSKGFTKGTIDPTLFTIRYGEDILQVQIYVDDIIFSSTNPKYSKRFEKLMHSRFEMSLMGEMKFFLGLQIYQSPSGIFINQAKYTLEILHKHGMDKGQRIGTPMARKPKLDADLSGNPADQTDYRSKIGSLMYLTSSRPDIVQAVCFYARYQSRPTEKHLKEVKRIFRYLRGNVYMGLWYPKSSSFELTAFSDADHVGCIDSRKSTSRGIQFLGDKLVSWMSKKQNCTAMSFVEAEYVALSVSYAQVMWMRTQLQDYGLN